jgi:tetratricopeptide (TPR) repeat protein
LVFVWALLSVSPLWLNGAVMWAASWNDWRRVLRLLPLLEHNPLLQRPSMRFHLGLQRAKAYVALGRLEDGFALFAQVSARSGLGEAARDPVRGSLLILAKRYTEAIELRRRAAAEDPRLAFDAALALLRYGGDVEAARELLASRQDVALTEMEKMFQHYAAGVLALADARFEDARDRLDAARASAERELLTTPYSLFGMRALIDAHRVLALAALGDRAAATEVLAPIARYLRVSDEAPLLARCEAATEGASSPS